MGATLCCNVFAPLGGPEPVNLQIYDAFGNKAVRSVNRLFRAMGTGAFHAAVEVYGREWSFGFIEDGTGIFVCRPRGCTGHIYREQVSMGHTELSSGEVEELLEQMAGEWAGTDYDLLHRNCCHFSDELCRRLGVGPIPKWVTNLAGAGATLTKGVTTAVSMPGKAMTKAQNAAIIAKAKAGEIEDKYRFRGKVTAKAKDLLAKAGQLNPKAAASSAASTASSAAASAASKAGSAARAVATGAKGAMVAGKDAGGRVLCAMQRSQG